MKHLAILFFILLIPFVFGANGDSYSNCDAPLGSYKCYAPSETPSCPNGLEYVRGWCSDPPGKVTRCCAPAGTQEGRRTGGPGLQTAVEKPANLVSQDFELFLEGTLSCEYEVKSNGVVTKQASFPCDSNVKITVGPNGDCRHEGKDTCVITNDGGYFGLQKTFVKSVQFAKPNIRTYGACRKYTSNQCADETECKASGGTPVRGYCPGKARNIKCCLYQVTEVEQSTTSFIFDKTKDKTLKDLPSIDSKLQGIKERHNVRIVIEIVDALPKDTEKNLRDKFHTLYGLDASSSIGMEMLLMYSKSENAWRGFGFRGCVLNRELISKIVTEEIISKNVREKNYDEALRNLATLLEGAISKKISSGDICKSSVPPGSGAQTCQQQCSSMSLGIINSCTREKCVNIDGCVWNNDKCDNICDPKKLTETVVIKKDENCANAETCPDLYLCRNGKVEEGYPIKASSGANLGNKVRRGDKRTPEGTFEILEKLQVVESGGQFRYVDEAGNDVQPKCDLNPAVTGIRDYWMHLSYPDRENAANNDDPRGSCIGIHGSASGTSYTLGCVKVVEKEKLSAIFGNMNLGDPVTIKDPYKVERQARLSSGSVITGQATGAADEFSKTCSGVCSGIISSAASWLGAIDCPKRCRQLGCYWEGEKCTATASFCPVTSRTRISEVAVLSWDIRAKSDFSGTDQNSQFAYSDENKIVSSNANVKLIAVIRLEGAKSAVGKEGSWYSDAIERSEIMKIKGQLMRVEPLGTRAEVKWYKIEPEGAHLEVNGVDLVKANCFQGDKTHPDCNLCPDVEAGDENYCWYQNLKSNSLWYKGADLIRYFQKDAGTGWSISADSESGTHRYRAEITLNGAKVSSAGNPDDSTPHKLKEKYYNKGITGDVHRISRRSDFDAACPDPFKGSEGCRMLSYLDSYSNVPWIWGATAEQRNSYIGFDCAELAAGAYVQMTGKHIADTTAHGLAVGSATRAVSQRLWFDGNGNTVDASGKQITVRIGKGDNELHIGDLLLLDYGSNNAYDYTTIFLGDKNGNSVLDWDDEITTSCHWIKETVVKKQSESIWESFLRFCRLKKDANWEEKHLNVEGVCDMNIEEELKKKPNIAWVIRRFGTGTGAASSASFTTSLENAIKSKHAGKSPQELKQWAETIVKYSRNKENAALIAAIIEKETLEEFAADPYIGIGETVGKWIGATDSLGCMQVQKANAEQIARETGRIASKIASELRMIDGCVFYGSRHVDKILGGYGGKINSGTVQFIASDYNSGFFKSRNAALQEQINDLLGAKVLSTTGLLIADPEPDIKNPGPTEGSIRKIVRLSNEQIRNDLKKSKTAGFETTATYLEIRKAWKAKTGREPYYAAVPQTKEDNWIGRDIDVPQYAADVLKYYQEYCRMIGCAAT